MAPKKNRNRGDRWHRQTLWAAIGPTDVLVPIVAFEPIQLGAFDDFSTRSQLVRPVFVTAAPGSHIECFLGRIPLPLGRLGLKCSISIVLQHHVVLVPIVESYKHASHLHDLCRRLRCEARLLHGDSLYRNAHGALSGLVEDVTRGVFFSIDAFLANYARASPVLADSRTFLKRARTQHLADRSDLVDDLSEWLTNIGQSFTLSWTSNISVRMTSDSLRTIAPAAALFWSGDDMFFRGTRCACGFWSVFLVWSVRPLRRTFRHIQRDRHRNCCKSLVVANATQVAKGVVLGEPQKMYPF